MPGNSEKRDCRSDSLISNIRRYRAAHASQPLIAEFWIAWLQKDKGLKSGGKPAFPTLRLLNFLDCFTLKAVQVNHHLNANQLEVRKVGLPPLFLPLVQSPVDSFTQGSRSSD
jgi:hypothetical protein